MAESPRPDEADDSSRDGSGSRTSPAAVDSESSPEAADEQSRHPETTDERSPQSTEDGTPQPGAENGAGGEASTSGPRERQVVVPTHVYKRVTVFSTLFAVVLVVAGFLVLDVATERATASLSEIDPLLALVGIGSIVLGAVTYAFSTRFQAEGMGNAKDESDEPPNNG